MTALSDQQLERASKLIADRFGIRLAAGREEDLSKAIDHLAEELGIDPSLAIEQISVLAIDDPRLVELFRVITINETHFFRNEPHFRLLRERVLPELIENHASDKTLRMWSAACSTGEEPYSLAMLALAVLDRPGEWTLQITGTDIDPEALQKAQEALYGSWSFRQVPEEFDRYFTEDEQGRSSLSEEIRKRVGFWQLNLAEGSWPGSHPQLRRMDLILCRNVLIYFDDQTTQEIIDRLYECLSPGGWLLVGHAENSQEKFTRFETHVLAQTIAYRKPDSGRPRPQPDPSPKIQETNIEELAAGDPQAAIGALKSNLNKENRLLLAELLAGEGRFKEALPIAEQVTREQPINPVGHYLLGIILAEEGRDQEALEELRRATFLERDFALARVALSDCHLKAGEKDRARRELTNAATLLATMPDEQPVMGDPRLSAARLREIVAGRLKML